MERRRITLENIHIGSRHREPDMAKVRDIARSIADVGLMHPPAVMFRDGVVVDGEVMENTPVLIYGRHRVLALMELGEVTYDCVVHDVDDLQAELMEIDENLARAELSPAQEAAHIRRRQEIWEIKNGPAKAVGGRASAVAQGREVANEKSAFATDTAQSSGRGLRSVQVAAQRGRELGPDIHRIVGTSLDKGVEMDALIKLPEPQRAELIERAAAGESVSARAANQPDVDPEDEEERRFWMFFAKLSPSVQRKVIAKFKSGAALAA